MHALHVVMAWALVLGVLWLFVAEIWYGGGDPNVGGGGTYNW